jgi:oligopeptide transport system substrate-binding protein
MNYKKIAFFLICMMLILSGCSHSPEKSTEKTLRLNLTEDPVSLDPRVVRSLKDLTVVKQLFEGLMRLDPHGIPQPAIAQSVEISEDLLTYTFYLREAYWNNHNPVTAYDFEYAWKSILDPNFASDYAHMLYPIKNAEQARRGACAIDAIGVNAVDDRTLIVHLCAPTPYFLELVSFPTYSPLNRDFSEKNQNWLDLEGEDFNCNGPFCLQTWSPQKELVFVKNPTYWDQQAVQLESIRFSMIKDNLTESNLFDKGELDWLGQPISHAIATEILGKMKEAKMADSYPVSGTFWLKFNTEKEPFNHQKVRKAFSYAINRSEIIAHILQGNQVIATGPLPPSIFQHDRLLFQDNDLEAAKQLFLEACTEEGWNLDSFPKITLSYSHSQRNHMIAQTIQQQWKKAFNLDVELELLEPHIYRNACRLGNFQVGPGEWIADFNDPLAILELFKFKKDNKKGTGLNDTEWQNELYISLLNAMLIEKSPTKRKELAEQAEKILIEDMPIIPLYHYAFDYAKKSYVQDVVLSSLGIADFKKARITRS